MLSQTRIHRIKCQGYSGYSDTEISSLAYGNRVTFVLCSAILFVGVSMGSIPILASLMGLSVLSLFLPYHPFDYIYNHILRGPLSKPKLPRRGAQLKFACTIAIVWIGSQIYFFYNQQMLAGYISGGSMLIVPLLVSTTDLCIPSNIYNAIFKVKIE